AKLEIHDFYNIDWWYLVLLNDEILRKYPFIKYLNVSNNSQVTYINHLTKLENLNACGKCRIDNGGISDLNLIEISIVANSRITNLNHMTKLKILDAWDHNCGIGDEGISKLNLIKLYASDNSKITNVNHMSNL